MRNSIRKIPDTAITNFFATVDFIGFAWLIGVGPFLTKREQRKTKGFLLVGAGKDETLYAIFEQDFMEVDQQSDRFI